ncbi:ParB/RepB/Spo0J family partition protein [Vibrio cholerae]|nr:ParB/RepB/Spo0J family partition protein [Vibrio cholerae]
MTTVNPKISPMAALSNLKKLPAKEQLKEAVESTVGAEFRYINLKLLKPDPYQPRKEINKETLNDLADSILSVGIIEPLVVRIDPDNPKESIIICGERRYMAAGIAGLAEVPCFVKSIDIKVVRAYQLIENVHREDMSLLDTARGVCQLIAEYGITQKEACGILAMSSSTLNEYVVIDESPDFIKELCTKGVKKRVLLALARAAKIDDEFTHSVITKALQDNTRITLEWAENVYRMCKGDDDLSTEGVESNSADSIDERADVQNINPYLIEETDSADSSDELLIQTQLEEEDNRQELSLTNSKPFDDSETHDSETHVSGINDSFEDFNGSAPSGFKKRSPSKAVVTVKVSDLGMGRIALEFCPPEPDEVMVEFSSGDIKSVKIIDCVIVGYE